MVEMKYFVRSDSADVNGESWEIVWFGNIFSPFSAVPFFEILAVIHSTFHSHISLALSVTQFVFFSLFTFVNHFTLFMYKTDTPSIYAHQQHQVY